MKKTPDKCKSCKHFNRACHNKKSKLRHSKYDNWCIKYGKETFDAIGHCLNELSKKRNAICMDN